MKTPVRMLFLCTGNSARSIMCEAVLRKLGAGRFLAFSAGSKPAGRVQPMAKQVLKEGGFPVTDLRSKSWDEFSGGNAVAVDAVVTVCDAAASEPCPVFMGAPVRAHWSLPDPAKAHGGVDEKWRACHGVFKTVVARLERLAAMPVEEMSADAFANALEELAERG